MGLCNSPDIFQAKMNKLLGELEFVRAYLDDLLIITKQKEWGDHLLKLEEVLRRLQKAGLKVNLRKSFFGKEQLEYLGFEINCSGIHPQAAKIEAIQALASPKNKCQLRRFIGMVNYYCDMWHHRSGLLAPLTALTSANAAWQWSTVHEKAFQDVKKALSKSVLLTYPDFSKEFVIYTDASDVQLGSVITQSGRPVAFYSRKLNPAQTRYTTGEQELLSIVETLKAF